MMNNKGFTLIEILVVVALLAVISVTVGISMSGMLSRQEENKISKYEKTIENAACAYAEIYNIKDNADVTIDTLIKEGLLSKDLTNPKTNKSVTEYGSSKVNIIWENYEKKCEFKLVNN